MAKFKVVGQSEKWSAFTLNLPTDQQMWVGKAHVEVRKDGNMTYITVIPSDEAEPVAVMPVDYAGLITESKCSTGKCILALSSTGSWSGGCNYKGWLIGRPGAHVTFNRKGNRKYYHFIDVMKGWVETEPTDLPAQTL